jgi:hypothetical protein
MLSKLALVLLSAPLLWPLSSQAADTPAAACDVQWQITPHLDASPRHLAVTLSFDAGNRTRSSVQLPSRWASVDDFGNFVTGLRSTDAQQSLDPVQGAAAERTIRHRPGERVVLQYQVTSPLVDADDNQPRSQTDTFRTRLGARWFQAFGQALLVLPNDSNEATPQRLCVDFNGGPEGGWWIGSHGAQQGAGASFRLRGPLSLAVNAVYLGGDLQVRERRVDGKPVFTVMPPAGRPSALPAASSAGTPAPQSPPTIDTVAERAARIIEAERHFWRDPGADHQLVVLHPNHLSSGSYGGTAVHQALVMHAPDDLRVPGQRFDFLVMHETLHGWIPDRFGPMAYTGRNDESARYWFSEGFTDYYTHRILLNAGLWTLGDYAEALNRKIDRYRQSSMQRVDNQQLAARFFADPAVAELAYARGELLAQRWNNALRAKGQPGLDPVMRQLLLPAAQAQRQGPMSKPLVTHRLLAALRGKLGESPLHDQTQFIDQGATFDLTDTSLGPCFKLAPGGAGEAPRYQAVADGLLQPRCRAWAGIGGDAADPQAAQAVAEDDDAPAVATTRTVKVCKKVKGKKAKVCKTTVVKTKAGKAGAAAHSGKAVKGGKAAKGKGAKAGKAASGKHKAGSKSGSTQASSGGKKTKPKPAKRHAAR